MRTGANNMPIILHGAEGLNRLEAKAQCNAIVMSGGMH